MAVIETIEGIVGRFWFHYDAEGDVLYVRSKNARSTEAYGEEDDRGVIVLRSMETNRRIGMTIVNWWKRFGKGSIPDSFRKISGRVETTTKSLAMAA